MCATPDKKALRERRSRKGWLRGWKVMLRHAGELRALCWQRYVYRAGKNYPTGNREHLLRVGGYCPADRRGLHMYRRKCSVVGREVLVPVTYQPEDVIAAENPKLHLSQVVVRKLRISQRAYDAAMKG